MKVGGPQIVIGMTHVAVVMGVVMILPRLMSMVRMVIAEQVRAEQIDA